LRLRKLLFMGTLYRSDDPALLAALFDGGNAFLPPAAILDGLTEEQAMAKPHGVPHSIAEIVAHMAFWQEWFNGCVTSGYSGIPGQAVGGWPAAEGWTETHERYLAALAEGKRLASKEAGRLQDALLPAGARNPFLEKETLGSGLLHGALHGGHHLGQIVTIRQLLGAWPPPAGSLTW
jgi:uncharacterized damage-inducible protein DinB